MRAEIAWYGSGGTWAVGAALEALEAVSPKLGMTVLRTIEEAGWRTLPIFTPTMVFEAACDIYWYGEDNEEAALEENCGDDAAERDAMRADMVTRRAFDEAYPKWAIGFLSASCRAAGCCRWDRCGGASRLPPPNKSSPSWGT